MARGKRGPGEPPLRPRRKMPKQSEPVERSSGWRFVFYLVVVGLIVAAAVAARHSSGGGR